MVARRGATLLELLVVLTLFVSLLTIILSFYVYAQKVTKTYEKATEVFERASKLMSKLEGIVRPAGRFDFGGSADNDEDLPLYSELYFSRMDLERPIDETGRLLNEQPEGYRLWTQAGDLRYGTLVGGGKLFLTQTTIRGPVTQLVDELPIGATVRFQNPGHTLLRIRVKLLLKQVADPSASPLDGMPGYAPFQMFNHFVYLDNVLK